MEDRIILTPKEKYKLLDPDLTIREYYVQYVKEFLNGNVKYEKYIELEEFYLNNNPNQKEINALRKRIDRRNIAEFSIYIRNQTLKERFLVTLFCKQLKYRGYKARFKSNGANNSGAFIPESNKAVQKADYLISVDDGPYQLYEIKHNPVSMKNTFKVENLEYYLSEKSSIILFYGTGRFNDQGEGFDYENAYWAILNTKCIEKMLELPIVKRKEVGNKLAVQILQKDNDKFFKSYKVIR